MIPQTTTSFDVEKSQFKESIPFIEEKYNVKILLAFVRGSHMYGTANEKSDVDVTFIYQQPTDEILKLNYVPYIDVSGTGDIVGHEIQKFIDLLSENNPTMLETMDIPEDCLIYKNPIMDELLEQKLWLSKLTKNTILGYGKSQIGKATGLNKNMNNPQPKERKSILDFCYWVDNGKTTLFRDDFIFDFKEKSIEEVIEKTSKWGLTKLENGKGLYAVYMNRNNITYSGLLKNKDSTQLRLSSIPKENERGDYMGLIWYNLDGFEVHCKQHAAYWKWVNERNEERFKMNQQAGKNVDLKNMSHLFRLLEMALSISLGKGLTVRTNDVSFLREIKEGKYDYDVLLEKSKQLTEKIIENYETVDLPDYPSREDAMNILLKFRKAN